MSAKRVFRKLSNVEHVRQRTGMWLGQNSPSIYQQHFFVKNINAEGKEEYSVVFEEIEDIPAKLKCLDEACMNAVDEYNRNVIDKSIPKRKKMSKLSVSIDESGEKISISDNGRGIPSQNASQVFLHLMYGENFEDQTRKEHIAGQNGVGISLVRIVSHYFFTRTIHNGICYEKLFTCSQDFLALLRESSLSEAVQKEIVQYYDENGDFSGYSRWKTLDKSLQKSLLKEMKKSKMSGVTTSADDDERGTTVIFSLDSQYFNQAPMTFSVKLLRQYLSDIAMTNPGLSVEFFCGEKKETFLFKNGLLDILSLSSMNYYRLSYKKGDLVLDSFVIMGEGKTLTWVNSIFASLGGSPVEYFDACFCDLVRKKPSVMALEKKFKTTATRNDVRKCFHVYHNFHHVAPRFKSQDKSYFINDLKDELRDALKLHLDKIVKKIEIIDHLKKNIERRTKAHEMALAEKEMRRGSRQLIPKFIPPTTKKKKNLTVFIAEGDSAIAGLRPVRDPFLHGLFPLRGKPLNVKGLSLARVLQNEEIKNIVSILNLPIDGSSIDKEKMAYDRICIVTDADYDGYAIRSLILSFFFEYWKSLFSLGMIYFVETPLYEVLIENPKKEKKTFYCISDEDFEQLLKKIEQTSCRLLRKKRNKGLGETSRAAMHYAIHHCLKVVSLDDVKKALEIQNLWFSKDQASERRKSIASYSQLFFDE